MPKAYKRLFEPIDIGPVTIPNRVYQPPHGNAYGLGDRQTHHRAEKAKGGFGLIVQEYSQVHESSDATPVDTGYIHSDETIEPQKEMVEAVHEQGSKAFIELWHGGLTAPNYGSRKPSLSSSQTPSGNYFTPKEMEHEDIQEIVTAFGDAAARAREVGYDGIEFHAAHGYLISQFLSPFYNDRDDEYGGSLENRMRFFRELIDEVRANVSDDMAVGTRYTIDERVDGGLTKDGDGMEIVRRIGDDLDFWDIDIGVKQSIDDMIGPSRKHSKNYQMEYIREATQELDVPVGGTGRITDPDDAEALLEDGYVDMIGMARQSIADPHWARKAKEGNPEQIRECIGCNVCVSQSRQGIPLICTQNPTVGMEEQWPAEEYQEADDPKGVVVVGGGPAGLEAARVAAERGHLVHLKEKDRNVGGRVNFEADLPDLGEWKRVRDWRETELERLNMAEIHTGPRAEMDYEDVRTYGAEIVIIATGSKWSKKGVTSGTHKPVEGWNQDHALTPEEAMTKDISDSSVVIFDEEGYNVSAGVAQSLADENDVTFVTPRTAEFDEAFHTFEQKEIFKKLYEKDVTFRPKHSLTSVGADTVDVSNVYSDETDTVDADYVVFTTMRVSNDGLYKELKSDLDELRSETEIEEVHAVGDCVSPRKIADAVYHGHEIGRSI